MYSNESLVSIPLRTNGTDITIATDIGLTGFKLDVITGGEIFAVGVNPYTKCRVAKMGCNIMTVAAGTTSTPIIKVWKNNQAKGDTAANLIGTIALGTTAAGNAVVDTPSSLTLLSAGDTIQFELDVADVDGTPTSEGECFILVEPVPDTTANVSTETESA